MAHLVLTGVNYWVDQFDLTTDMNQHSLTATRDIVESTTFSVNGTTSTSFTPGLFAASMTHNGYFDSDGADEPDDALFYNTTVVTTVTPDSAAAGNVAFLTSGLVGSYVPWSGSIGDMAGFTVNAESSNATLVRGVVLHQKASRSSSGNTSGILHGAVSSTQIGYAALHVFSGTASTLDVVVQSDSAGAFSSPTNRITFTQATGATAEWASVTGPVTDTYWRVLYTIGGGTWTFAVSFGIA